MKEIYKIYASTFFVGLSLSVSVISTLFYLTNGLTQVQIATIFSVFMISLAVLEIPTGGIADTFGHKTSVFLGISCMALGLLITGLGSEFNIFLIAIFLSGLGFALNSGAYSSLIHDILNKLGKGKEFTKVQGRTGAILLLGPMIASPIMSLLYKGNIRFPYLLGFVLLFIAAVIILFVRWEFKGARPTINLYFQKMKNGVINVLGNRAIIGLIIISIGLGFGRSLFNQNINQPFQINLGLDVAFLGTVAAIISGSEAVISAFSHRIFGKVGSQISLLLIVITSAILLVLLSQINTIIGLFPILLYALVHTYRENVVTTLYLKHSNDDERATTISTTSFLTYIFVGLMLPIGGFGIDVLGMKNILVIIGIITIILGATGIIIYNKFK